MQKITSYLYPNRVQLTTDLTVHPTEWRIVYQRKFKIYKGLDNELLLDFKNAEQKRINVSDKTIKCVIMDQLDQEVYTTTAVHSATPGLATVTIPAGAVEYLTPQFLNYSIYIENNDGTKSPIYGDTQFGVTGTIDLLGRAVPKVLAPKIIDTFNYMENDLLNPAPRIYTSESVEVNHPNDIREDSSISLEFWLENLSADITVQITEDVIVHAFTEWQILETFSVTSSTDRVSKVYNGVEDYSNNVSWLRIQYERADGNTGSIDKVLVRL